MPKTILVTGSNDGIGLETARALASLGHHVLLHGRSPQKLAAAQKDIASTMGDGSTEAYVADLSRMANVEAFATTITDKHRHLDVLINNAGVFNAPNPITPDGLDVRFAVNTIAPYLLAQRFLPLLKKSGRVVNLSSAAQSSVDLAALTGKTKLPDGAAYAQSKLAITMWSRHLAHAWGEDGPAVIAVNPGSMLGTKMVREAFGVAGGDPRVGAEIVCRVALDEQFAAASGQYFDNDTGQITAPHPDALNPQKSAELVETIEAIVARTLPST